jgi:hypothetical protein
MTSTAALNVLLGLAIVVYICSKQLTWRPVDPARMLKLPLILGAAGIISMASRHTAIHPIDVVILGLSAVFALASGTLMGRIARFRPSPADPRLTESRTGVLGIAIWLGLVAVRVTLDVAGHQLGSDIAISTGSILLVLALNRFASALVVSARRPRRSLAMAGK